MSKNGTILAKTVRPREAFNPANKKHLIEFKFFMENNTWQNGCPFLLEEPYLEIPAMCKDKYVKHKLSKLTITS